MGGSKIICQQKSNGKKNKTKEINFAQSGYSKILGQ